MNDENEKQKRVEIEQRKMILQLIEETIEKRSLFAISIGKNWRIWPKKREEEMFCNLVHCID